MRRPPQHLSAVRSASCRRQGLGRAPHWLHARASTTSRSRSRSPPAPSAPRRGPCLSRPWRHPWSAAAKNLVPVTLELGGKSPQLVFADAHLAKALPFLVNGGIQNAGQTCSAASRILVERSCYQEVVGRMADRYASLAVGPATADL